MDSTQLVALASGHKWLALIALVVGLLVRVFKDDTKIPGVIPKPARPWIALGLGLVLGTVQQKIAGATWGDAIASGVLAGVIPIVAHKLGIEWLRDGKELPLPGLMKPSTPSDDSDKSDPPQGGAATGDGSPGLGSAARAPSSASSTTSPRTLMLALAAALLVAPGCAMTFEEARLAGLKGAPKAAPGVTVEKIRDEAYCRDLDSKRGTWSAVAKGAGIVGGASGLASIPVGEKARPYVIGGTVLAGVVAAVAVVLADGASSAWVRDCSP